MKRNDLLTHYKGGTETSGFNIRTYDSVVEFEHRAMFEHKHSDFEISLVVSGSGTYHFKDRVCQFSRGDIFVLGSNQIHCITDVFKGEQMVLFNIQMESRLFWSSSPHLLNENHLKLFNDRCMQIFSDTETAIRMKNKILELRRETLTRALGYKIRIYACLMSIIGELVLECGDDFSDKAEIKKQNYVCMERAMEYIDNHLSENFTLEEVAAVAGYSRNYFSTLFTALNGLSPWDYITIRRIAMSKTLLVSSNLTVTEIAGRCGYSNLSNFNRHFKRLVGCSPKEYSSVNKR